MKSEVGGGWGDRFHRDKHKRRGKFSQKAVMQTILEATTLDHVGIECGTPYS